MQSRQHNQTKNIQKQTSAFSSASTGEMFESRPFVVQQQKGENSQQSDLKTSLMQAEKYGHHLNKMQPAGILVPKALQPKIGTRQPPIQLGRVKAPTKTSSGRISKPPQGFAPASGQGIKKKKIIKRKQGVEAQKRIPAKKLQQLLEQQQKNPQQPYGHLKDSPNIGNQDFTASQKKQIYAANMKKHGQLTCDLTGQCLMRPQKSKKGVKPSPFEAQIDHIEPWSKGGTNSFKNAMLLSRYANRFKSNK